jgi:uncharacterized protein (DUF433 family)
VEEMKLEAYFNFLAPDDIRLKGSRIGIESILYEYIHRDQTPETILDHFPTLTLEQIYATILYYLHNRKELDQYMIDWLQFGQKMREAQDKNPPPIIIKLRAMKKERIENSVS